jgi:hypothetical protein
MPMTHAVPEERLDQAQFETDPLADRTIADILGPWEAPPADAGAADLATRYARQWERIDLVNQVIALWQDNQSLEHWQTRLPGVPQPVAEALRDYVAATRGLPEWAESDKIARAEEIFFDQGVLSCTLLFCASLPECYVVPDLAEVLHTTGQLEQRTDWRIRSTAAMVFPVMMRGGLTAPQGGGVAQVLKVRLIHAMVRNLILRAGPQQAQALRAQGLVAAPVRPLSAARGSRSMHHALFAHGWDMARGLPCNQEEQAYTLLTFSHVYLRGLRTLGVGLDERDELAVLHAWNVVGHLVGTRRELMAFTVEEAQDLFSRMQARGRAQLRSPDPRPGLADALFRTLAGVIPWPIARPFPLLLTRRLIGRAGSRDLGIDDASVPLASRLMFVLLLALARLIDTVVRLFVKDFSLSRLVTRVLGYHLLTRLLMDQTRPLKLPTGMLAQAQGVMSDWGADRRAPRWLNALEDRLTMAGPWSGPARP